MQSERTLQKFIIGLSGGIGSGKSTVSRLFSSYKIDVVDADEIAKQLVVSDSLALQTIVEHFGKSILTKKAELDRAQLRRIIFNDQAEKAWLENLLHPLIRQKIFQLIKASSSAYIILVVPLLLESQHYNFVNRVLIIDTDLTLQINRTSLRDNTDTKQVKKIIASQISREKRLEQADDIIQNNRDVAFLKPQVLQLHQQYLQLAQEFIK